MKPQFDYLCGPYYVSTAPFRGDASIHYKWTIAKDLERLDELYGKPITVLYFGDYDHKGLTIPESALRDIRDWCSVDFSFRRVGLTLEQVGRYGVPENFERPGEYQWEALNEEAAQELIRGELDQLMDTSVIADVEAEEGQLTERWRRILAKADKGQA